MRERTREDRNNWMNTISERMEIYAQIFKEIGTPADTHEYNRANCYFKGYKNKFIKSGSISDFNWMCTGYGDTKRLIEEIEKRVDRKK